MNAVHLEIVKIEKQWEQEVKQHPDTPLYICLGEKHEINLFEAFFKYQNSEDSKNKNLYIVLSHEFDQNTTYGESFINEWKEIYQIWKKNEPDIPEQPIERNSEDTDSKYKTDAPKLVQALTSLYTTHPYLEEHKIFVLISPPNLDNTNCNDLELWIREWCHANTEKRNIKLIIKENINIRFCRELPANKHEFRIKIDISKLMLNTASQTNKNKGSIETNFQQQLLIANHFLSQDKKEEAFIALEKAAKIAKAQNVTEAECTTRLMMAEIQVAFNENEKAENQFQKALKIAGQDTLIGAQMHLNYVGFLLSQSKTDQAIEYLEKAIKIGEKIDHKVIQMECHRMIGLFSNSSQTIPRYEKCINLGEELPKDIRRSGTMSYTAGLLLEKYGKNSEKAQQLSKRMDLLVGDDWENLSLSPIKN